MCLEFTSCEANIHTQIRASSKNANMNKKLHSVLYYNNNQRITKEDKRIYESNGQKIPAKNGAEPLNE